MRRSVALLALLFACVPQIALAADPPATSTQPNIVVLMLDDYAAMDHRVFERLPNIKSLFLDQGLEATDYWGNDPLCCPGRANFLTAQWAHISGVNTNDAKLLDPTETLATELHDAGYYTNVCGKYLNKTDTLTDKSPPGWDHVAIQDHGYYRYWSWVDDLESFHGATATDYSVDVFANYCDSFIQEAPADRPMFVWMTPYATHKGRGIDNRWDHSEPATAPRYDNDPRCAGIAPWLPPNYNAMSGRTKPAYMRKRAPLPSYLASGYPLEKKCRALLAVDDWLGRVVADLTAEGRYDNTIFILTSDNGMGWGSLRWETKYAPYTAQMPLFITWPGVTPATATQFTRLVTNVDVAPTLCEFAGCVMGPYPNGQPADGQSFAGLIAPSPSLAVPDRSSIVMEEAGIGSVTPPWQALMVDPAGGEYRNQWYYIQYATGEKELYNLSGGPCWTWVKGMSGDPCMLTNAKTKKALVAKLKAELAAKWGPAPP